ncbi:MAG: hypothetical protein QM776_14160 [Rhodocyclaceae bacterium]
MATHRATRQWAIIALLGLAGCASVPGKYSGSVETISQPQILAYAPFASREVTRFEITAEIPEAQEKFTPSLNEIVCERRLTKTADPILALSVRCNGSPETRINIFPDGRVASVPTANAAVSTRREVATQEALENAAAELKISNPVVSGSPVFQSSFSVPTGLMPVKLNLKESARGWTQYQGRRALLTETFVSLSSEPAGTVKPLAVGTGYAIRDSQTLAILRSSITVELSMDLGRSRTLAFPEASGQKRIVQLPAGGSHLVIRVRAETESSDITATAR